MPSGSKPISGFNDGVPAAGDYFVFESVGGITLKIAFADLQAILAIAGTSALFLVPDDPQDPEEPMLIPGPKGDQGDPGATFNNNIIVHVLGEDGIDGQDAESIPGPIGATGPAGGGAGGDISYSPGSFTVVTETQRNGPHTLKMTGSQRITLEGTGRLSLHN